MNTFTFYVFHAHFAYLPKVLLTQDTQHLHIFTFDVLTFYPFNSYSLRNQLECHCLENYLERVYKSLTYLFQHFCSFLPCLEFGARQTDLLCILILGIRLSGGEQSSQCVINKQGKGYVVCRRNTQLFLNTFTSFLQEWNVFLTFNRLLELVTVLFTVAQSRHDLNYCCTKSCLNSSFVLKLSLRTNTFLLTKPVAGIESQLSKFLSPKAWGKKGRKLWLSMATQM